MSDAATPPTTTSWDPKEKASGGDAAVQRGFFADLLVFAWENKIWWIAPTVIILLGLGILVYFAQKDQIAPFFYALF
jgi:hypothetical protein